MNRSDIETVEGWWNPKPLCARSKYHYVREGRSLCGRWLYTRGETEIGKDDHPENCAACRRAKAGLDRPQRERVA